MILPFLLQLPAPPAGAIENVLLTLAAIASMVVLGRKLLPKKTHELSASAEIAILAEKVTALTAKVDSLGARLDHLGDSIHHHLNQLEAGLARVDERTRK